MSLIFSNLVVIKTLSSNHRMYNLYTKFVKILEICKQFSENLVNESGNVPRRGPVPRFSDLEVVALSRRLALSHLLHHRPTVSSVGGPRGRDVPTHTPSHRVGLYRLSLSWSRRP